MVRLGLSLAFCVALAAAVFAGWRLLGAPARRAEAFAVAQARRMVGRENAVVEIIETRRGKPNDLPKLPVIWGVVGKVDGEWFACGAQEMSDGLRLWYIDVNGRVEHGEEFPESWKGDSTAGMQQAD